MKTRSKSILLVLCAVLLVVGSVMGTLAYLTSVDSVVNTFTIGKVDISLDEAKVNQYGQEVDKDGNVITNGSEAPRVDKNEYKLVPGHTYKKDPTVHVGEDSEDCWLIVVVSNPLASIEAEKTIAQQMTENGWTPIDGYNNVYGRENIVSAGEDVVVFKEFTVKSDVTTLSGYESAKIEVAAIAIQADGFDSAKAALTASGITIPQNDNQSGDGDVK